MNFEGSEYENGPKWKKKNVSLIFRFSTIYLKITQIPKNYSLQDKIKSSEQILR